MDLLLRKAEPKDIHIVWSLLRELAVCESRLDEFALSEAELTDGMFGQEAVVEAVLAFKNERPVGVALYYFTFPTFSGRKALFIEDLFVCPDDRRQGIGLALLSACAKRATAAHCGRMEWWALDWNEQALSFYESLGAEKHAECVIHHLSGGALRRLGEECIEPRS